MLRLACGLVLYRDMSLFIRVSYPRDAPDEPEKARLPPKPTSSGDG